MSIKLSQTCVRKPINSAYAYSRGWRQGNNTVNRTARYINARTEVDTSESGIKISLKDRLPDAGPGNHVNRQGTQSQGYTPQRVTDQDPDMTNDANIIKQHVIRGIQ